MSYLVSVFPYNYVHLPVPGDSPSKKANANNTWGKKKNVVLVLKFDSQRLYMSKNTLVHVH